MTAPGTPLNRPTLVPPPATGPSRWFFRPQTLLIIAAVGVAAVLIGRTGILSSSTTPATPPAAAAVTTGGQPPPAGASPTSIESRKKADDAVAAETARRDILARAKFTQQQAAGVADEVSRTADEGLAELDRFEAEITPLLTNDAGRAVAGQAQLVRAFRAVYELERPAKDDFARMKLQADEVVAPVRKALASPDNSFQQTDDTQQKLQQLLARARTTRDAARASRSRLAAIVSLAKVGPVPSGTPTLQAAIQSIDFQEALEAATVIEAAREVARKEATALMAETKGEAVRLAGRADARRETAKAEVERTKVDLETAALKTKAEKDRLRAKALSPEVKQDLAVFLAKGYTQPSPGVNAYERFPGVLQPVSYSRLVTMGCLEQTPQGLAKLLRVGAEPRRGNDRPQWKFYAFELRPEAEPFLKKVQALLIELGPVLVEDGLLAP
jgi:hypothetical protein